MASPPAMSPSKASPLEASPSASASAYRSERPDNSAGEGMQLRGPAPAQISSVIDSLKKQVATDRCVHIKKRMEENRQKMVEVTNNLFKSAQERRYLKSTDTDASVVNLLEKRQKDAIDMQNNLDKNGDNDSESSQEDGHGSAAILLGASIAVKNVVQPIKLAEVKKVPPYTTWIFLDRNQRMTEDQSVFGRRRIYYDQSGGEALIASDSDEEVIDEDEEKKEFVDSEDYILRMTIKEVGVADAVWDALAWCFSRKPCEVKARYEVLTKRENATGGSQEGHIEDVSNSFLDRDLDTALDSFDNLFCRRCLVFDCRLHGCSQDLIFPAEKQLPWSPPPNEESTPCGLRCYRQVPSSDGVGSQISRRQSSGTSLRRRAKGVQSESATTSNAKSVSESSESESRPIEEDFVEKRGGINKRNSLQILEHVVTTVRKRQKNIAINSDSDDTLKKCNFVDENITNKEVVNDIKSWKAFEISLFEKGLEIFGRNSCLIARNLLNGMKTCSEVFHFMNHSENKLSSEAVNGSDSSGEGNVKGDGNDNLGTQLRRRSRFLRRRGRVRRLKYSWKSTGYHSFKKRISEKKDQPCRQYNPCGCQTACGKECSCLLNGTCCEKYCGCPRSCKNRFRGCHCAKSQCRSRQCPCFAAGRECDPDVCRNCWISCGDGTLGIPWQRGDNYECRNMKLLLKQQQRVLLGRSNVSGWGAFLKKCVAKHEYLGEYTGELISHREADKRGKIYDRVNSSFLFNLNDQFVLDAFRKGDKLKFANHSPDPNCYAKVIMVAGDHRVGIFAKERIMAGEELFYDYRYEADRAPAWAKKPETSGSKKEEHTPSNGRAKKIA